MLLNNCNLNCFSKRNSNVFYAIILITSSLLISGCGVSPNQLGVSRDQWNNLADAEKEKLSQDYLQYKDFQKNFDLHNTIYAGPPLRVYFEEGTARMPPDFQNDYTYTADDFFIKPGQCLTVELVSIDTNNKTNLGACYDGLNLMIDPSHFVLDKKFGSVRFNYNPLWKRGFTYTNVFSTGYARLKNSSVTIKAFSINEQQLPSYSVSNTQAVSAYPSANTNNAKSKSQNPTPTQQKQAQNVNIANHSLASSDIPMPQDTENSHPNFAHVAVQEK